MKPLLGAIALTLVVGFGSARAQGPVPPAYFSGAYSVYGAPGFYGTSYGTASYGVPRTFTAFNSPYGVGYGLGYPTPGFLPGKYGSNLWRPGLAAPGYLYGAPTAYRTFPIRVWSGPTAYGPPIGVYAPSLGPAPPPMY